MLHTNGLRSLRQQLDYNIRANLTLVSKRWRKLSISLLYGRIILTKEAQLQTLVDTLRRHPVLRLEIKFLHIAFRDGNVATTRPFNTRYETGGIFKTIRELYRGCPNLMIATGHDNFRHVGWLSGLEYPPSIQYLWGMILEIHLVYSSAYPPFARSDF